MISRTGVLLGFALGAWTVGGFIAAEQHWGPFGHDHWDEHVEVRALVPATDTRVRRMDTRVVPLVVRLTPEERALLPRGYSVERAERAMTIMLEQELRDRTATHRLHDPNAAAGTIPDQIISARTRSTAGFDPTLLWSMVHARLEATGQLPQHAHLRREIRVAPAHRGTR